MTAIPIPKRGNKYSAQKQACNHGHIHDSRKEARRCGELHLLQRGGVISDLRIQPQYFFVINGVQLKHENGRRIGYRPDFGYVEGGAEIAEDSKGVKTEAYVLRAAIFRVLFPGIVLRET